MSFQLNAFLKICYVINLSNSHSTSHLCLQNVCATRMSLQRHPPQRVISRSFFAPHGFFGELASVGVGEGTIELNATQTVVQTTSVETLPLANVLAMTNKYSAPVPKRKLTNSHFFQPVGDFSMLRPKGLSATCRSVALQANGTLLMHMDSRYMP